jgi:hypothetical protein
MSAPDCRLLRFANHPARDGSHDEAGNQPANPPTTIHEISPQIILLGPLLARSNPTPRTHRPHRSVAMAHPDATARP